MAFLIRSSILLLLLQAKHIFSQFPSADVVGWWMVEDLPPRDSQPYFNLLRTDYSFPIQQDYISYSIDILIDPCKDVVRAGGKGVACCTDTNRAGCQHHGDVHAGPDLQVAYMQNAHIVSCRGTIYENDPNCGTYLEVHRPGDKRVLADVRIDAVPYIDGYKTVFIATHRLCLGLHEIWWVVRTRSGPKVQRIRAFNVLDPSCEAPPGAVKQQISASMLEAIP
eukprot:TRINITY_DN72045_c0_g1_i1.p1 TRINITY_DN72045_c0_g1~~TRINITY_DN72045_c0_g1_i1.p1  ORF type:complete len:223 (-),score=24.23 TRINITY_DN72045_c0_g1_i1:123-791(-)